MAEGGGSEHEGQATIAGGSEFVFDFYCEVCRDDDKHLEAAGFCVDCGEYLCGPCVTSHKRARPSRLHKILDQSEMPKDTPLSQDRVSKVITTTCEAHIGEPVKFYCKVHRKFGCSTCFATVHKSCTEIDDIVEKSETILDSDECKDFVQNMNVMKQKLTSMIDQVRVNISETGQYCLETISSVKEFRKELNDILDEVERQLTSHAQTAASEQIGKMESIVHEATDMSARLQTIASEIDELQASKRVCQLYINMKEMSSEIEVLRERLRETEERNVSNTMKFEPNDDLRSLLRNTDSFGNISQRRLRRNEDLSDTTAVHMTDIDIDPTNPSRRDFHLIGSAVVSETRLIIADHQQHAIKLLDTHANTILDELKQKHPFDVAVLNKTLIAVTLHGDTNVILIRVNETLTIEKKIPIAKPGRGVAYSKGRLVVSSEDGRGIQILDLDGNLIKSIQRNTNGKHMFSYPRHLCVSNDDLNIYVSDKTGGRVVSITFDGIVNTEYTGLIAPQKMCTDRFGSIFVCGDDNRTVHMLSPDLKLIKVILSQTDGLNSDVLSISHCRVTDRLFVGMRQRFVKVYQLS